MSASAAAPSADLTNAADATLLAAYVRDRSEVAFAELVRRHLGLVYGAACRRLGANALAADVAQSVFLDLARSAASLRVDQTLAAWLYTVTQRTAADVLRRESRRLARERTATELHAMATPSWADVAPLLDDALARLSTAERTAVLLRYFENRSLREVGTALAVSDDAAQKRLTRALDRLRTFFHRRGITVTAAALAADLSAHAAAPAPATLATSITTQLATLPALSLSQTAATFLMTTTQKVLVATTVLTLLGGGLYEARVISRQNAELSALREQATQLKTDLAGSRRDRAAQASELADERAKTAKYAATDPEIEAALDEWLQNVVRLKEALNDNPGLQIPELQFLTAKDWLQVTRDVKLDSPFGIRQALSDLRGAAKRAWLRELMRALHSYLASHDKQRPTTVLQLAQYCPASTNSDLFARYGVFDEAQIRSQYSSIARLRPPTGKPITWAIVERVPVDGYFDTVAYLEENSSGIMPIRKYQKEVSDAIQAYQAANGGQRPSSPAQLAAYLKSPIDPAFVQDMLSPHR